MGPRQRGWWAPQLSPAASWSAQYGEAGQQVEGKPYVSKWGPNCCSNRLSLVIMCVQAGASTGRGSLNSLWDSVKVSAGCSMWQEVCPSETTSPKPEEWGVGSRSPGQRKGHKGPLRPQQVQPTTQHKSRGWRDLPNSNASGLGDPSGQYKCCGWEY